MNTSFSTSSISSLTHSSVGSLAHIFAGAAHGSGREEPARMERHVGSGASGSGALSGTLAEVESSASAEEASGFSGSVGLSSVPHLEGDDDDSIKMWWRHVQAFPLLTGEQEVELAKRIEAGDEAAFHQMVESNLRLVANIARKCRRFAGNTLQLSDLIQEGSLGLIRAVHKFDHRKGFKFSTYASYWIRQAVMRSIAERGRSVRLPVHMVESVSRAEKARVILTQELQRVPTQREIAAHLQIAEHKVGELLDRGVEPMSLDVGVGDEDDSILADFIEDQRAQAPEENATHGALQCEIRSALHTLSEREAQVIALRFGLDGTNTSRTLDEVGAVMHLTRERIRQIEKTAIKRLRACPALQETARFASSFSNAGHTTALA